MKRLFIGILIIGVLQHCLCDAAMITGRVEREETISAGNTKRSMMHFAEELLDYTAGGVTFTYPADWFSEAPMVEVSVQLKNASYSSSEGFYACIESNSSSQTVVRINKDTGSSITEAETDDVTVHLIALGTP